MKLRTKILIGSGILIIAMVILMYLLPTYFVRKDIHEAAREIQKLLVAEHDELLKSQKLWIENAIQKSVENNDALLFMLSQRNHPTATKLIFGQNSPVTVWQTMAHVASIDPDIGMVQLHSPSEKEAAVLTSFNAKLYKAKRSEKKNHFFHINLDGIKETFLALPVLQESEESPATFYVLFPAGDESILEKVQKESENLKKMLGEKIEEFGGFSFPVSQMERTDVSWSYKMSLIRILTPLYASFENPPAGLARLDNKGAGYAVLSREIFSRKLLFDDAGYFKAHPPRFSSLPLASGQALITDKANDIAFQGNTLLLQNTYLTLGFTLEEFVKELALASNKTILLQVQDNFWIGFDGTGKKLPTDTFKSFSQISGERSVISIDDRSFVLTRVISLENGKLNFYEKHEGRGEKTIVATLFNLETKLSRKISLQLSLIAFLSMLTVLIFIARIGLSVVYPVTKLAAATDQVMKGHYGEISLPNMGKRQDEVAVLTRSFEDMVKGLEEREKIRGVLDKVVSKDVADEILRTQIHLGGEDRVVSILFSDIRDFTRITANKSPQETIQLLNECMTKISRVIEAEGGVIDKYVGDEVMAIFGAPTSVPDHALRAVSSGMLMIETLKKWNLERAKENKHVIEMGIGVHAGLVVAGNMGAEDRLNYTVLGANVNLAARLCDVAQKNQLIISEKTLNEPNIKESFHVKSLPPINIKGFEEPVQIYEVIGFKWEEG